MLTRISPAFAVANCVSSHSELLGDQIPTRSPGARPSASSPAASASTRSRSARQLQRTPWLRTTSAGRSGQRATVRSNAAPTVSPSKGMVLAPWT